jgi:hypothetical protein
MKYGLFVGTFLLFGILIFNVSILSQIGRLVSAQQIEPQQSDIQLKQNQASQPDSQDPFQKAAANDITVVRDSETILLKGQTIPAGDYIHLYDASPYKIINGHLATKIPCDSSFQPKVNILAGQAPKVQAIQLHVIEEISKVSCVYIMRILNLIQESPTLDQV